MDGMIVPRATRREWIGLAVLMLPTLLIVMDLTVLHLAVPHLSEDLQPTSTQLLWIVDIYGFMIAGSLITMGTLGDRIGRRKLLMLGATAFATSGGFVGGYRGSYDIARQYQNSILPLRRTINEQALLEYNGMLIDVFELLGPLDPAAHVE